MIGTAEYDVKDFEDPNCNKGVYARFFMYPKEDQAASAEAGRPIFKEIEAIEIVAAGNSNNIVRRPASDLDKQRFHAQYALFKSGDAHQLVGTPLTEVPWITRSQVEELLYRKIRTLEDLAGMSDAACNVPGMYDLKRKATAWLEKAEEAAPFTAMQAEMSALRAELAAMKAAQKDSDG
jgi:hypothetical protein